MTVLWVVYMICAALDSEGGIDGLAALFFQALIAPVFGGITLIMVGVAGLPIRLVRTIRNAWLKRPVIAFFTLGTGLLLVVLSILLSSETDVVLDGGVRGRKVLPNIPMILVGWFLTAFGAFHLITPYLIDPVESAQDPQGA